MTLVVAAVAEEENSVQRLQDAQKGLAEASWPKKPDNRSSPLSGKMKSISEISPRYYGQEKEFRTFRADSFEKGARWGNQSFWEGRGASPADGARWNPGETSSEKPDRNEKFQPQEESTPNQTMTFREMDRPLAPDWSSRAPRTMVRADGQPRMYAGRLIRVREQVQRDEETKSRDLGSGRREQFNPREVETLLSQPVGKFREEARGRFPEASPPAVEDN